MIDSITAEPQDFLCRRCKHKAPLTKRDRCENCGVHKDRPVMSRNSMRRRNIGGKRGRNSGKVGTSKNK